jgi:UV excision repair protein RAD23
MRIIIKTLQQVQCPIEVEAETTTILQLKEKISSTTELSSTPVSRQKLIHAGRVLADDSLLLDATPIKDGDFVVLMSVTPKAPKAEKMMEVKETTSPIAKQTQASALPESQLVTGDAYEEAITRLLDMGFPKEQVIAAMRASFNNPERAVEYLTSGVIPEAEDDEEPVAAQAAPSSLDFLRRDPQFRQLRIMLQQNPEMLEPIIAQLSQTSPELLNLIEQNREEFYSLLMDGGEGEGEDEDGGGDHSDDEEAFEEISSLPEGAQTIQISEEEKAAIDRLGAMGFERSRVIEAYFACEKDEQLAANFLLESMNDD